MNKNDSQNRRLICQLAFGEAVVPGEVVAPGDTAGEGAGVPFGEAVVGIGDGLGVAGVMVVVGVTVGLGVVPVGVQPASSTAAKMKAKASAMSFFMIILLLTQIISHGCKTTSVFLS